MSESRIFETGFTKPPKSDFWRRQFADETTPKQIVFDVILGVVGPVLCFVFDPIVFHGGIVGPPLYPDYQLFVYFLSGLEIAVLCLWLLFGAPSRTVSNLIGAALIVGGIFCLSVGLLLLPLSALGLVFGIGVFGFTPFLTALVYLRNGFRAWNSGSEESPATARAAAIFLSLVLVIGVPAVLSIGINGFVQNAVDVMIKGDPQHAIAVAQGLGPMKYLVVGSQLDRLVQAYIAETNPSRKQALKSCYQEITGEDIEVRARIVLD